VFGVERLGWSARALDVEASWQRFLVALESDVGDVQGGTTKEGTHMGVISGTLDLVQRSYAGTEIRDGVLYFDPWLPARLDGLSFAMQFRGTPIRVTLAGGKLMLAAHPEGVRPINVGFGDEVRELRPATSARSSSGRPRTPGTSSVTTDRRTRAGVPGSDLRCRRRACRLAAREGVARVAARADEGEWNDIRDRTT
jgi:hypothetical protein